MSRVAQARADAAAPVRRLPDERIAWRTSIPFLAFHLVPLAAVFTGVSARAVVFGLTAFWVRMFFITAGYHRYFSHRSFTVGRVTQFVLAFGATTTVQKGPLWWAANHRDHHRYTDTDRDPHSPQKGVLWSHVGWILSDKYKDVDYDAIPEFSKYPELRFIDKHDWIGPWAVGIASFLVAGWSGLVIGFFASTVALWHATFLVNSAAHIFGRRRYATSDTSRNSLVVALLTMGEGWHNNHHHQPSCARQGFRWWEVDITYYVLRALKAVRVVKELREPSRASLDARRVRAGHLDVGIFRLHVSRALKVMDRRAAADPGGIEDELEVIRRQLEEVSLDAGARRARVETPSTRTPQTA